MGLGCSLRKHTHRHVWTHMHSHLKLTDQRITSKSTKRTFSQDLTSDWKHTWLLVPFLYSNDKRNKRLSVCCVEIYTRKNEFIAMHVCMHVTRQIQRRTKYLSWFQSSANASTTCNILPSSSQFFSLAVRPDAPESGRHSPLRWHQYRFRATQSPKNVLLPQFSLYLCKIHARLNVWVLSASLQQITLSLGKYSAPPPARQGFQKGS